MKRELRKWSRKALSHWSIAVEDDCVVVTLDRSGKPVRTRHDEAWKATRHAEREIQKRMLSGFFFARPEPEAAFGDAIYEGAFKRDANVFDFHPSRPSIAVAQVNEDARGAEIAIDGVGTVRCVPGSM